MALSSRVCSIPKASGFMPYGTVQNPITLFLASISSIGRRSHSKETLPGSDRLPLTATQSLTAVFKVR